VQGASKAPDRVEVPEIQIPAGIGFEYETKIGKDNRSGLERIARHLISENNLPRNATRNLAITDFGQIYRFTRLEHPGASGQTELVLIEAVAPIPATKDVPEAELEWNVDQPRPGAMSAGTQKIRTFELKRDKDWREDEWRLVTDALTTFPDSVLNQVAGVNFKRRPCQDDFIKDGRCIPKADRAGDAEAGQRSSRGTSDSESITVFSAAFEASPTRYGMSTVLVSVLAHEVGHQVDLRPLDVAQDTFTKGNDAAFAELKQVLEEPEPKGKDARRKLAQAKKLAEDKYDADKAARQAALDNSRSLSGVGLRVDGGKRKLTDAPLDADGDFLKAATQDGLALTNERVTSGSITTYAKKNIVEQFADLFSTYLTDPNLLQAIRPHVYDYFAARFPK
jgi:hypothetical protein